MNIRIQIKCRSRYPCKKSIHNHELFWLGFCIILRHIQESSKGMRRFILATVIVGIVAAASAFMVNGFSADDVKGTYSDAEKKSHIRIFKGTNGKYYGKLAMLKEPNDKDGNPKRDPKNPDPKLRDRTCLGMVIMRGFNWDGDEQEWNNGTIYNPEDGKSYDAYMYFKGENKNKLYLRGYVMGMPFLGQTTEWTRVKK